MGNRFSSGKYSIAECDRCGFRYKLKQLEKLVVKADIKNIKVCPECWDPDQPQLMLGMYPVEDPQAVREPRPDLTAYPGSPSRDIQWGWNPVGGARAYDDGLTPNNLVLSIAVGNVTIAVS